jgi:hypothetical protein
MLAILVLIVVAGILLACSPSKLPSYQELRDFLRQDDPNKPYVIGEWECHDMSFELNKRAEDAGIRCALVLFHTTYAPRPDWQWHYVNAFKTKDQGIVYIEPATDQKVQVEIGLNYFKVNRGWDGWGPIDELLIGW